MAEQSVREILEEQVSNGALDGEGAPERAATEPVIEAAPVETEAQKTERLRDEG